MARQAFDPSRLSVQELRRRFLDREEAPSPAALKTLAADPRQGVQQLYSTLCRRNARTQREERRQTAMLWLERELWQQGIEHIAGVDEVGVGPMAGPVVAAAVVFPTDVEPFGVDDSKRLDAAQRERLAQRIRTTAVCIGVGVGDVEEIERLNIYHAGLLAMRRAVENLSESPQRVLTDARHISGLAIEQHPIRKGDARVFSIAAASIIAKIWRDDYMCKLARRYPGYGFEQHKGYCTAAHQKAVRELGPCPDHRRSYGCIREMATAEPALL